MASVFGGISKKLKVDPVGWGILGCANIAEKVCAGIAEAANARVVAVASRSLEKAQAFAKANAPDAKAYSSYDEILEDENVQVVYVPLPTTLKQEWVSKAAGRKKYVLCEKPIAATMSDVRKATKACEMAGVQFMDNTMFMHHDRLPAMREVIDDAAQFGKVKNVITSFTIPFGNSPDWADTNVRMNASTEPLGSLGDLGWYCIRFSLWAFDWEEPLDVSCHYLETTGSGVPITAQGILRFSGGRSATFDCSFRSSLQQWAKVVGEKRTLSLEDFVINHHKDESKFTVEEASIADRAISFPVDTSETVSVDGCIQHTEVIESMSRLAAKQALEELWPKVSLQTQRVLLACHASAMKDGLWVKPSDDVDAEVD